MCANEAYQVINIVEATTTYSLNTQEKQYNTEKDDVSLSDLNFHYDKTNCTEIYNLTEEINWNYSFLKKIIKMLMPLYNDILQEDKRNN